MSEPIEPRVRFQAQFFHPLHNEWWEAGYEGKFPSDAHDNLREDFYKDVKTRIVKQTTTFEVVEEMEPKS